MHGWHVTIHILLTNNMNFKQLQTKFIGVNSYMSYNNNITTICLLILVAWIRCDLMQL